MTFVHLNCHSDRSIGRGLIKPSELVAHYKEIGAAAACITDYGNLNSAVQLNKACLKHDILPIFGMELNVAPDRTKKVQGHESLVVLAKNKVGFYNLVKLATLGSMFSYYIPRVDKELIAKHSEGLIALTADMTGVAAHGYFRNKEMGIESVNEEYSEIFGDDLYFEMEPTQTDAQRVLNEGLMDYAEQTPSCKLIATGDPHYLKPEHREIHQMLMKSRNFRNMSWEYPFKGDYHVRSHKEMIDAFSDLHGYDASEKPAFQRAIDAVDEVIGKVEAFDLRAGTKVPDYTA